MSFLQVSLREQTRSHRYSCHTAERDVRCRLSSGADPLGNRHGRRLSCTGPWMARCSDRRISVRTKESAATGPNRSLALPTLAPSKWVAEGRKGDLSRTRRSLSPQSRASGKSHPSQSCGVPFAHDEASMFTGNIGSMSKNPGSESNTPSHSTPKNKERFSPPIAATPQNAT